MAEFKFHAQQFDSQTLPEPLPSAPPAPIADIAPAPAPVPTYTYAWTQYPAQAQAEFVLPPKPARGEPVSQAVLDYDLGKQSEYVGLMDTPAKVQQHWDTYYQMHPENAEQCGQQPAKASKGDRDALLQARLAHQQQVFEAQTAWRAAVDERKRIDAELEAKVRTLHEEYKRLRAVRIR